MKNSVIEKLNEEQSSAVKHYKGPCMVYAGPGSGKTTVITHRISYLINKYGVNPENILVITFTKAAAEEMKIRFYQQFDIGQENKTKVNFGTFHGLFFKILRRCRGYTIEDILNEGERYLLIKNIVKELGIEGYLDEEFIKDIILEITLYKSDLPEKHNSSLKAVSMSDFKRIIKTYENYKKQHKKIDFDDMLTKCYMLLRDNPSILKELRLKYPFILIDEFQDINSIQFEIIKLITKPLDNLFVVGDDDQSIYSFRGAKPYFILNFEKIYQNAKTIILSNNYRSQQAIIKTANSLIGHNKYRINKKMMPVVQGSIDINYLMPKDKLQESKTVVETITSLIQRGYKYKEIALIYRTNLSTAPLIDALLEGNIPYSSKEQVYNIYNHWVAKDIIAYLKVGLHIKNSESIKRIINKPNRYITRKSLQFSIKENQNFITVLKLKGGLQTYQIKYLEALEIQLKALKGLNTTDAIAYIREHIGYDDYIRNYCLEKKISSERLIEILDELQELGQLYQKPEEFLENIDSFKEKIRSSKSYNNNENRVELLTMHSAKGLEYKAVIIVSAVEGMIPHSRSVDDANSIEEERRLFYVAVTRAKEHLYISSPLYKNNKKNQLSRFVEEMKKNNMDTKPINKLISLKKEFISYLGNLDD